MTPYRRIAVLDSWRRIAVLDSWQLAAVSRQLAALTQLAAVSRQLATLQTAHCLLHTANL